MSTLNNDRFLVLRRDGTHVRHAFVLDPEDNPAASAALQAMASAAEQAGLMTAREAESFRELAAEWGNRPAPGTPERVVRDRASVVKAISGDGPYEVAEVSKPVKHKRPKVKALPGALTPAKSAKR
jgi:hypothetical protein